MKLNSIVQRLFRRSAESVKSIVVGSKFGHRCFQIDHLKKKMWEFGEVGMGKFLPVSILLACMCAIRAVIALKSQSDLLEIEHQSLRFHFNLDLMMQENAPSSLKAHPYILQMIVDEAREVYVSFKHCNFS